MQDFYDDLKPNRYYSVYNRSVSRDKLFLNDANYEFFLEKAKNYLLPVTDFLTYNLLPNHFHFFVRVKKRSEILAAHRLSAINKTIPLTDDLLPGYVLKQWSDFCNSYAKSFNHLAARKGRLFMESIRRFEIVGVQQFKETVRAIHNNAIFHGLRRNLEDWPYSSYESIVNNTANWLKRDEVLGWFGGLKPFIKFHKITSGVIFNPGG
jgi:putative transposase